MRIIRPCLITLALTLWATSVWALDFSLTDKEQSHLNPAAQAEYKRAVNLLDHMMKAQAMDHLLAAQKTDPANVPIRLLVAKFAISEGRMSMGEDAINFFRIAETSNSEILAMPAEYLKPSELKRAEEGLQLARNLIIKQAERDARRVAVGKEIIKERAKELYPEKKEPTPGPTAVPGMAGAQGQAGRAPAGAMMDPAMMMGMMR